VSNLHKQTKKVACFKVESLRYEKWQKWQVFSEVITDMYTYVDSTTSRKSKLIADDVYQVIMEHKVRIGPSSTVVWYIRSDLIFFW
jgi:predicted AlkP superfamily phosphohydrolase/phosphomutase